MKEYKLTPDYRWQHFFLPRRYKITATLVMFSGCLLQIHQKNDTEASPHRLQPRLGRGTPPAQMHNSLPSAILSLVCRDLLFTFQRQRLGEPTGQTGAAAEAD